MTDMIFGSDNPSDTYEANATAPERVVAFDTDLTIDYAAGPVPLAHVIDLRDHDDALVWATGHNQTLRDRARIPGVYELTVMRDMDDGAAVERADRMRLLRREFPDADEYIVVDDVDLRQLEPEWSYYHPAEYVVEVVGVEPSRWSEELDATVSDYLKTVGSFSGQFPPEELFMDEPNPYSYRTEPGVREPVHSRSELSRREVDRGSTLPRQKMNTTSSGEWPSFLDVSREEY